MQEIEEDRFAPLEASMRKALRQGNARVYASLCDELGIPFEARQPHLYSEGKRPFGGYLGSNGSRSFIGKANSGLDVSSCILSGAAIDYLKSLGDKGIDREDYMARFRQIIRLGSSIPSSLKPMVGASEEEWSRLYFALADKARSSKPTFPDF